LYCFGFGLYRNVHQLLEHSTPGNSWKKYANTGKGYWLLWPGVMIMVCVSLAELFIQYKIIAIAFKSLFQSACSGLQGIAERRGKNLNFLARHAAGARNGNIVEDPTRPEDQVKDWMWIVGLLVTIVIAMIICQLQWVSRTKFHYT
jgi:hypothetical protein